MKEPKYCKQCGCYIPDDWGKCPSCGFEINFEIEKPKFEFENAEYYLSSKNKSKNVNKNWNYILRCSCKNCKYCFEVEDENYGLIYYCSINKKLTTYDNFCKWYE